ncbi:MAG: hypothetical protein ABIE74_10865 [Pseudomonadota bacterium]
MNKKIKRMLACLGVAVLFIGASFMSGCKKADDAAATETMTQEQTAPATEAPAAESEAPSTQETTTEGTGSGN